MSGSNQKISMLISVKRCASYIFSDYRNRRFIFIFREKLVLALGFERISKIYFKDYRLFYAETGRHILKAEFLFVLFRISVDAGSFIPRCFNM